MRLRFGFRAVTMRGAVGAVSAFTLRAERGLRAVTVTGDFLVMMGIAARTDGAVKSAWLAAALMRVPLVTEVHPLD